MEPKVIIIFVISSSQFLYADISQTEFDNLKENYLKLQGKSIKCLSTDELQTKLQNLDKDMELEIERITKRYHIKRQPIVEGIDEKRKQQAASAGGSDNMGSSLVRMASSFLGFAKGGAVSKGQPVVVGERGPELFVPRSSGTIVPNNKLGGGGSTSVVVNVDASGTDVQGDDSQAKELGTLISVAVQGELIKQQRPGGLLASVR